MDDPARRRWRRTWLTRGVVALVVGSILTAWAFAVSDSVDLVGDGTDAVAGQTFLEVLERVARKLGGMTLKIVGAIVVGGLGLFAYGRRAAR